MAEIKGYFKGRNGQLIEVVDKKARNDNEIRSVIEEDENGDFVVKQGKFSTSEEQVQVALKDDVDALSSQIANLQEQIQYLKEHGVDTADIESAVNQYLSTHPIGLNNLKLSYSNNVLKLMNGTTTLSQITIQGGGTTDLSNYFTKEETTNLVQQFGQSALEEVGGMLQNFPTKLDVKNLCSGIVTPEVFGAIGDGENDDTEAINTASAFALENNQLLCMHNNYKITDTITLNCNVDGVGSYIFYYGAKDRPAVVVESQYTKEIHLGHIICSDAINDNQTWYFGWHGWENENFIGLKLNNIVRCKITFLSIIDFTVGLQCIATNGGGFAWNSIEFRRLYNNKIQHHIVCDGEGSWLNANDFIGGDFGYSDSGTEFTRNTTIQRYFVKQEQTGTRTKNASCNSNVLRNYYFENHYSATKLTCIYAQLITHWLIDTPRIECDFSDTLRFAEVDFNDLFDVGTVNSHSHDNKIVHETYTTKPSIYFIITDSSPKIKASCYDILSFEKEKTVLYHKDFTKVRAVEVYTNRSILENTIMFLGTNTNVASYGTLEKRLAWYLSKAPSVIHDDKGFLLTPSNASRMTAIFITNINQFDTIFIDCAKTSNQSIIANCFDSSGNLIQSKNALSFGDFRSSIYHQHIPIGDDRFSVIESNVNTIVLCFTAVGDLTISSDNPNVVCTDFPISSTYNEWHNYSGFKYTDGCDTNIVPNNDVGITVKRINSTYEYVCERVDGVKKWVRYTVS